MSSRRKKLTIAFLIVYLLSFFFNSILYVNFGDVKAEEPIQNVNIVALFVDKSIYSQVREDIQWYAQDYIQNKISDTKALVFPIDRNNFKAHDIYKMLENLYSEGEKDKSSRLLGTILIGDLPLPVVKSESFVFPSVYPYVDFVNQKYVYNKTTKFFELADTEGNGPEIWHSVINLGADKSSYNKFFSRLKDYNANPSTFVEKKIWYDDFASLKKSYSAINQLYYITNFAFLEDLAYHRYNPLLLSFLNANYYDQLKENMDEFATNIEELEKESKNQYANADPIYDDFKKINDEYFQKAKQFKDSYMTTEQIDSMSSSLDKIPTLLIAKTLEGFIKKYSDLYGNEYLSNMRDNILTAGRWDIDSMDSHYKKTYIKDEISKKVLVDFNMVLENAVNKLVEENKYYMKIPVVHNYELHKVGSCGEDSKVRYLEGRYENNYFGKYAVNLTGAGDFSIFRGTFKNYIKSSDIKGKKYQTSDLEDINTDINTKSIGSSYAAFSRQIQANRGYNYLNSKTEADAYIASRCSNSETVDLRAQRNRGGASPLNVQYNTADYSFDLKNYNYTNAWNPSHSPAVGGWIYDIAGSKLTESEQKEAYSYKGYSKYASLVKTKSGSECSDASNVTYCNASGKTVLGYADFEFKDIYAKEDAYKQLVLNGKTTQEIYNTCSKSSSTTGTGEDQKTTTEYEVTGKKSHVCANIKDCDAYDHASGAMDKNTKSKEYEDGSKGGESDNGGGGGVCPDFKYDELEFYEVGIKDSRVYHNTPTSGQIQNMNLITSDRPIDDPRYISFLGLGGDEVKLLYPDIFNVEVFVKQSDKLVLKSYDEIKQSLKDYLVKKVQKYNETLKQQYEKRLSYYALSSSAFDFLAKEDALATPNRAYEYLNDNYLVDLLGDENIERIAANLYYVNNMWKERSYSQEVTADLKLITSQADVNKKIKYNTQSYLKSDSSKDKFINPNYEEKGYEVGYINSDGIDTVYSGGNADVPNIISQIQSSQVENGGASSGIDPTNQTSMDSEKDDKECGVDDDGSVDIFQWPGAFACWMSKMMSKPFGSSIESSFSSSGGSDSSSVQLDSGSEEMFGSLNLTYNSSQASNSTTVNTSSVSSQNTYKSSNIYISKSEAKNTKVYQSLSAQQQSNFDDIKNNLIANIDDTPVVSLEYLDDINYKKYLKLNSKKDLGTLDFDIILKGNNCFELNGNNICKQPLQMSFNPYSNPQLLPLNITQKTAGMSYMELKVCKQGTNICYSKDLSISFVSGKVNKIELFSATDKVVKGGKVPFMVVGYDSYGNKINQTFSNFKMSVEKGDIGVGSSLYKEYEFSNFSQAYFLYDTSLLQDAKSGQKDKIRVWTDEAFSGYDSNMLSVEKEFTIVDPVITVSKDGSNVNSLSYDLPDSYSYIYPSNSQGFSNLDESKIIKLTMSIKDPSGVGISTPITVYSQNGTLQPGVVKEKTYTTTQNGSSNSYTKKVFEHKDEYISIDGNITFYLHPSFQAGDDNLVIQIPGLSEYLIPIKVKAASPRQLDISFDKSEYNIGEKANGTVYLQDVWGNTVDYQNKTINVGIIGNANLDGSKQKNINLANGVARFELNTEDPGGKLYVYSLIDGESLDNYAADYETLHIKNISWPKDKLNVMYLNLFGNDWGNMWGYFSDNKNIAKQIINNSDKVLALTTELINPDKVKSLDFLISSDLRVFNFESNKVGLDFNGGNIVAQMGTYTDKIADLTIGNFKDFEIKKVETFPQSLSKNSILYLASQTDSNVTTNILKDNKLIVNDLVLIDFEKGSKIDGLEIAFAGNNENGYGIWDIDYQGVIIGNLLLYRADNFLVETSASSIALYQDSKSMIMFGEGSTNGKMGVGVYGRHTYLSGAQKSFKSIEDSIEQDDNIGYRAGYSNIVDFANGSNVGDATRNYQSEYLINYGDPVLKRIDKNELNDKTSYDYGLGKRIYSLPSKSILKVIDVDINNDGLNDIIIAYGDGTIKLLKNYGGTDPYVDMGDLMSVADGISDIFVGDVDTNGFKDIIVKSQDDRLRTYLNKNSIFDVDGKLVCLDVQDGPDRVSGVNQIFFEDMNLDGGVDIVTNDDAGDIKIFYGGKVGNEYKYLSNLSYKCDDNRKSRQTSYYVKGYGLKVEPGKKTYDESLIHRKGIVNNSANSADILGESAKTLTGDGSAGPDKISGVLEQVYPVKAKFQSLSSEYKPVYEDEAESYDYAHMLYLSSTDAVEINKTYQSLEGGNLKKGDKLRVTINIEGKSDTRLTYLEQLKGPWAVGVDETTGQISGFNQGNLSSDTIVQRNVSDGFLFKLDNVEIKKGSTSSFSYDVNYYGGQVVKINVEQKDNDTYPDITVLPTDGCIKCSYNFMSQDKASSYKEQKNDYAPEYNATISDMTTSTQKYYQQIQEQVKSMQNTGKFDSLNNYDLSEKWVESNFFNLVGYNGNLEKTAVNAQKVYTKNQNSKSGFVDFVSSFVDNANALSVSSEGSLGDLANGIEISDADLMKNVESLKEGINNVLHGLCKGFSFGKDNKCGNPIPFNMAFLSPGTYNVMGCPVAMDMGTPVFFFPGTIYAPVPIPFPNALKGFNDGFYWIPGGIYPSMIRIYLSPTLSMGLGVVVCFGEYFTSGFSLPPPLGTIAGNCVVAGTSLSLNCDSKKKNGKQSSTSLPEWMKTSYDIGTCDSKTSTSGNGKSSTPLYMVSTNQSGESSTYENMFNADSFLGGAFSSSGNPVKVSNKLFTMKKQSLQGGKEIQLKIEGGTVKGLVQCIIKKWLDKQIRYIINNLTNMTVYVYLPDLSSLSEGFDKLNFENLEKIRDDFKKDFNNLKSSWNSGSNSGGGGNKFEKFAKEWLPSKNAFKKAGDTLSNPFEQIEKLLESVPFFKVQSKKVNVQIPMIYQEDIIKYSKYLQSWVDRQESIIGEWTDVDGGVDFKVSANKLISSVKKNMDRLEEYSQFPFKLYDWIHSIDKYLKEIISTVKKFIKNTIGWLDENAKRFEGWVDLIILLIGIMETWQILIDWSVEWRTGCAKCRQDDYDQYTCILSLLCISLPVLPIPPFKIPDIYLDFSNINLGIDIVLPKFGFTPMALSLPRLPDLPRPPSGALGFSLPSIPLLPELPDLPELPSLNINFNLELPTLPPAPKIPEILPAIKVILNILKFIGRIYCIIKQGIGLVEEWNSKARVEQLTNRTRRVFPFDFLDITFVDPPKGGSDIRLDAYLNLKFNFDTLYQVAKSLTSGINEATGKVVEAVSSTSTQLSQPINGGASMLNNAIKQGQGIINKGMNVINDTTSQIQEDIKTPGRDANSQVNDLEKDMNSKMNELDTNIDINIENPVNQEELDSTTRDLLNMNNGYKNSYGSGLDYQQAYVKLKSELLFLKEKDSDSKRNYKTDKIIGMIDMDKGIKPNYEGVQKVGNDFIQYLETKRTYYNDLATKIRDDYDGFLDDISKDRLVSQDDEKLEFSTSLFLSNEKVKTILKSQEHPAKTYLDMNAQVLKGFQNSINTHDATSLNMTQETYQKSKQYINKLAYQVDEARSGFTDKQSYINQLETLKPATQPLLAAQASSQQQSGAQSSTGTNLSPYPYNKQVSVDPTQFVKGFFVKGTDGDYYNIMNWEEKAESTYKNSRYRIVDANKDGGNDVLWWDSNSVYIKYMNQNDTFMLSHNKFYKEYYDTKELNNPSDIKEFMDDEGYIKLEGSKFKVWDSNLMVNNFKKSGYNYENISFSWNASDAKNLSGYVIKLIQRQDVYYDKKKQMQIFGTDTLDEKFVLIVGENFDEGENKLLVEDSLQGGFVYDYKQSGKIVKVIKTTLSEESLSAILSNLPRKWYYAKIAALVGNNNVLTKTGPWSNQQLAGAQLRGDSELPTLSSNLLREKTGKIVSQGYSLNGYINTNYVLNANWQDNGFITQSWVEKDGEILQQSNGNTSVVQNLYFTGVGVHEYNFSAIDHAGNINTQKVTLNIGVPNISINKVETTNLGGKIMAELSNDIDDGVVQFQRLRDENWTVLTGITNTQNKTNYEVTYNQNYITGGIFDLSDEISFYNSAKQEIGAIKVDSGKLQINDGFKDSYDLKVDFTSKTALLKVIDKAAKIDVFAIFLKAKEVLLDQPLTVLNGNYELIGISSSMLGEFKGGYCLRKKDSECVLYTSPKGAIYVPTPYNTELRGTYEFIEDKKSVKYVIYDLNENKIAELEFVPEELRN